MIRLELKWEPDWLDRGHGARVHVRPCTTALMMAARAAERADDDPRHHAARALGARTAGFVKALGRLAIHRWDGVGDHACEPAPVTPEGIDASLDLWPHRGGVRAALPRPRPAAGRGKKRLSALAEWHLGGGPPIAAAARRRVDRAPRASPAADGNRCPYLAEAPADRCRLGGLGHAAALRRPSAFHRERNCRRPRPSCRHNVSAWPWGMARVPSPSCCPSPRPA